MANNKEQIFCLVVRNGEYLVNNNWYFLSKEEFYSKYPDFNFNNLILVSHQYEEYSSSYDCGYLTGSTASFYVSKSVSLVTKNIIMIMNAFRHGAEGGSADGFEGISMFDIENAIGAEIPSEKKAIWERNEREANHQLIFVIITPMLFAILSFIAVGICISFFKMNFDSLTVVLVGIFGMASFFLGVPLSVYATICKDKKDNYIDNKMDKNGRGIGE